MIHISINSRDTMITTTGEGTIATGRVILARTGTLSKIRAIMIRRHNKTRAITNHRPGKTRAITNHRPGKTRAIMTRRLGTMAEAEAAAPVQDEVASAVGRHGEVGGRAAETIGKINTMMTRGNSTMIKVTMTTHRTMIKAHMLNYALMTFIDPVVQ